MEFGLNNRFRFYINTTPLSTATLSRIAKGITSFVPSYNDVLDQSAYIDGNGFGSTDKTGAQWIGTASGHRVYGDASQDFVAGLKLKMGDDCKTNFVGYDQLGNKLEVSSVTVCNIVDGGGEAQGKTEFTYELHGNGKPTLTPGSAAAALTATVAVGVAVGTTSFSATPGSGNHLGYRLTAAALTPNGYSWSGDDVITYTSGDDIAATAGQYINMYEIDADGSVIKFLSHLLEAGDIKA